MINILLLALLLTSKQAISDEHTDGCLLNGKYSRPGEIITVPVKQDGLQSFVCAESVDVEYIRDKEFTVSDVEYSWVKLSVLKKSSN